MTRPRVLLVSRNLPPLLGGMERLNHHAYLALRQAAEVSVAGPRGCRQFLDHMSPCMEFSATPVPAFLAGSLLQSWRLARQTRPDWVLCGSGTAAPAGLVAARTSGARLATFLHGLDIVAEHRLYQAVFLPAIRRSDVLLVNSRHTAGLAERAGISAAKLRVIHPGVTLPDLAGRESARQAFRQRHRLADRPVLLIAGRLTARKGVAEFVRAALPGILQERPDVRLAVVGREPSQALKHRQGVTDAIRSAVAAIGAQHHVLVLGEVDDADLSRAYFGSDLLIFPVLDLPGDVEGFGMVAIEAAAHGLPTVAFAVGGVPDAVAEARSGWLVSPGDYTSLAKTILRQLDHPDGAGVSAESCRACAIDSDWEVFGERLRTALGMDGQA